MKTILVLFLLCAPAAFSECRVQDDPSNHQKGVEDRGDHAMGFDHSKTTHHFLLKDHGGVIQITTKDPKDSESAGQIRKHLAHIARLFAQGDFEIPMFIHNRVPPGVPVMKERKEHISYKYEEIESGGKVVISTEDPEAVTAVHEFLRFQIEDHHTGDPK